MKSELIRSIRATDAWAAHANACRHFDGIPSFAAGELARLYGHICSSVPFFETSRPTDGVFTYVSRTGGRIAVILVFRVENAVADVLNEFIDLSEDDLRTFADYIFGNFSAVWAIRFHAVRANAASLPYPVQRHNSKENWVITLPSTPEEYTARLGRATRDNMKRCARKMAKDFPSFSCTFFQGAAIEEDLVREIIALSRTRITAKNKPFGIDEAETRRILTLARRCGAVDVMRIDGRLCAGTITYTVGADTLAEVIAHDPAYNDYSLGTFCYYTTICDSIRRGTRRFHLGGGREAYKSRLLAVRQDMDRLLIHRSYAHMAFSPRLVVATAVLGGLRQAKLWMLAREKSAITQAAFAALTLLRRLRRPAY